MAQLVLVSVLVHLSWHLLVNLPTRVIVNCSLCVVATVFVPDRMATQLTQYFCWPNILPAIYSVWVGDWISCIHVYPSHLTWHFVTFDWRWSLRSRWSFSWEQSWLMGHWAVHFWNISSRHALVGPFHGSYREWWATERWILIFCPRNTRVLVGNEHPFCIQAGEREWFWRWLALGQLHQHGESGF